jgi:hypothetical protein
MTWTWQQVAWKVVWNTPLVRIRWLRCAVTAAWGRWFLRQRRRVEG